MSRKQHVGRPFQHSTERYPSRTELWPLVQRIGFSNSSLPVFIFCVKLSSMLATGHKGRDHRPPKAQDTNTLARSIRSRLWRQSQPQLSRYNAALTMPLIASTIPRQCLLADTELLVHTDVVLQRWVSLGRPALISRDGWAILNILLPKAMAVHCW